MITYIRYTCETLFIIKECVRFVFMSNENPGQTRKVGRYWLATISAASGWNPPISLPVDVNWIKGQKEVGEGGFEHWQVFIAYNRGVRVSHLKKQFERTGEIFLIVRTL